MDLVESGEIIVGRDFPGKISCNIGEIIAGGDSPGKTGRTDKGRREDSTFEAALLGTEKIHQHLFVLLQQNHR